MTDVLRVLALETYPRLAAATRYRVLQYAPLLEEQGIVLDVRPFLSDRVFAGMYDRRNGLRTGAGIVAGMARRLRDVLSLAGYDAVFVQREAALVGPPLVEWLAQRRMPFVLDLDDATYIDRHSEVFGSLATLLKWPGKTDHLIRWAAHVVCGNPTIAEYVRGRGKPATVLPTMVDVDVFTPRPVRTEGELVVGWIGSHSTFPYLRTLLPVFRRLAKSHRFRLRVVGAGTTLLSEEGLPVESLPWDLHREVEDLRSFDIAVYPIVEDAWATAKSGFKAIQYLSCGVPYVASPVGVVKEIGTPGVTHFEAVTDDEWHAALSQLLTSAALRERMGKAGRAYAVAHYSTRAAASELSRILRNVTRR